jgi:hypothetical protein
MKFQIVDLDGCIADDRWRRELIPPAIPGRPRTNLDFDPYHSGCPLDPVGNLGEIVEHTKIIILTARPLTYYTKTYNWLLEVAGIFPSILIMRNPDDARPSVEVKREQVGWLFEPNLQYGLRDRSQIVQAIDDREDIVRMYAEEYGLPARVVRIGDEEHPHG